MASPSLPVAKDALRQGVFFRALAALVSVLFAIGCGAASPARVPANDERRARNYARRADATFRDGRAREGLALATRALVVRIAACGFECPEVGMSFVQLGDFHLANAEPEWAAQCYKKALEVLAPHQTSHAAWIAAARQRLADVACSSGRSGSSLRP